MSIFAHFVDKVSTVRRGYVQLGAAIAFNSAFLAPWLKSVPCPGFNCYACPGAIFACPIGSLQHFVIIRQFPLLILGFLGVIGAVAGRMVCGWLCPFGAFQELLHKIPFPRWHIRNRWAPARYVILIGLVFVIPWLTNEPWFCKLCPAGALEAGLPLVAANGEIRALAAGFFALKMVILGGFLVWFVTTERPFCRFVCPLGAIYSLFNRASAFELTFESSRCRHCDVCAEVCPTALYPPDEIDSSGCVRCLECVKVCPSGALGSRRPATSCAAAAVEEAAS